MKGGGGRAKGGKSRFLEEPKNPEETQGGFWRFLARGGGAREEGSPKGGGVAYS